MKQYKILQGLVTIISFIFLFFVIGSSYKLFKELKELEQRNMEIWLEAQKELLLFKPGNNMALPLKVIESNSKIPLIIETEQGKLFTLNIPKEISEDTTKIKQEIIKYSRQNNPFKINENGKKATLYFGDMEILSHLKNYPFIISLMAVVIMIFVILFYKYVQKTNENKLWVSLAKETAHQIGTPLSSLMGWIEIIKPSDALQADRLDKMAEDVKRLAIVSSRFSRIGFLPKLKPMNIVEQTSQIISYLKERISSQVTINMETDKNEIIVNLDKESYKWALENIIINAIDAIEGKGNVTILIKNNMKNMSVKIIDNGKGISSKILKRIFESGFTTKKKGWGLGLALTSRIIKNGHKANIKVSSKEGKGSCFELIFNKVN